MNVEATEQEEKLARAGMYAMFSGVLLREFDSARPLEARTGPKR